MAVTILKPKEVKLVSNKPLKNDLAEDLKDEIASSDYDLMPKGHKHFNPNKNKSPVPFVQQISDNISQMFRYQSKLEKNYGFKSGHWAHIFKLSQHLEWNTNALIAKERKNSSKYGYEPSKELTITDIANILDLTRPHTSKIINKVFIPAGILFEMYLDYEQLKQYGRNIETRMLFMNPELFIMGGAGQINPILFKPFKAKDRLEEVGVKLDWKLWHKEGQKWAKLINRRSYLPLKKRFDKQK